MMQRQSEIYLEALGASIELTAQMKQELDTLGYTVVHNVANPDWLVAMRNLIDELVEKKGITWPLSTIRKRRQRALPTW